MQKTELQAMTVVQLRKVAKENGVKLSAGIDKEGIVERIAEAMGAAENAPVAEPVKPARRTRKPKEEAAEAAEAAPQAEEAEASEPPKAEEAAPAEPQKAEEESAETSPSADVTSAPGAMRPWNRAPEQSGGYRPVYRQAWQARSSAPVREPVQKPAWQQQTRPVGTVNRFGPQQGVVSERPQPYAAEPQREMEPPARPAYQDQSRPTTYATEPPRPAYQEPRSIESAPKTPDGYRLGYRAAPQRTSYQPRNDYHQGGYGGSYQQRQNNYNQPYRQQGGYGYQQPRGYQPPTDTRFNDNVYRMQRDPTFTEQVEEGQVPDLLQVQESEPASGVLEILPDGYGFLRGQTLLPGKKDIYVSMAQVRRYGLRTGDFLEGRARVRRDTDKFAALLVLEKLNGHEPEENPDRLGFDQLTPIYPKRRITLEGEDSHDNMIIRLIDLIAPIGFGQRAMIVSPPNGGGLTLLKEMCGAIKRNDADAEVLMLLIDVAPEEVTEIREAVDAEVFASTFADAPETQTRVSETMLERAMRLVEDGRNVVILLESLTKLTRAYQSALVQGGRPMTNTVTPAALVRPKRFFGAARNTRDAGSLTIIATIAVETGSRVDDIIFEEFKGNCNMEVRLCSPQSSDPVYPMIDLQMSGTKKDDMLLTEEQQEGLRAVRKVLGSTTNGEAVVQLIDMMQKTRCNADLLNRLQDWVVLWEKSGYLKR